MRKGVIIYIIFGIFSIFLLWAMHGYDSSQNQSNIRREEIVLPIPILIINNQNEECCICLEIDNTISWRILPCGHKFHGSCISKWIRNNKTCPVCRLNLS